MSFWTSFAKQVIFKVFTDGVKARVPHQEEERRCVACGRMVRAESLHQGRCIGCRLEQEQEQKRHQRQESQSHRTRDSQAQGTDLARAYTRSWVAENPTLTRR